MCVVRLSIYKFLAFKTRLYCYSTELLKYNDPLDEFDHLQQLSQYLRQLLFYLVYLTLFEDIVNSTFD